MKTRQPYGMGYIEFLAVKQEVDELRENGYRFSLIYRMLVNEGKISMSYTSFSRYASGRNRPYGTPKVATPVKELPKKELAIVNNAQHAVSPKPAVQKTAKPDTQKNIPEDTAPPKAESFTSGKQYSLEELFFGDENNSNNGDD